MKMGSLMAMSYPVTRIICVYSDHSISSIRYEEIIFQRWFVNRDITKFFPHPLSIVAEIISTVDIHFI